MQEFLAEIDQLIRAGKGGKARQLISEIKPKAITREHACAFAEKARRLGMHQLALKTLYSIVRSENPDIKATADEKTEYAASLAALGSYSEAERMFSEVSWREHPKSLILRCTPLAGQWRYEEMEPLLERYLQLDSDSYMSKVARINLLVTKLYIGKFSELEIELERFLEELERENLTLLLGNALEIKAMYYYEQQLFDEAIQTIDEASAALKEFPRYSVWLKKWRMLTRLATGQLIETDVNKIRSDSLKNNDYETLRECDLFWGCHSKNEKLVSLAYFGTPSKAYRKKIRKIMGEKWEPPQELLWNVGDSRSIGLSTKRPNERLDVDRMHLTDYEMYRSIGAQKFSLLVALTRDFYKPLAIGQVFSSLFEDTHYNPISSPQRIATAITRFRNWCSETNIPLKVDVKNKEYFLGSSRNYGILRGLTLPPSSQNEAFLEIIKAHMLGTRFKLRQVTEQLSISKTVAFEFLTWCIDNKKVERIGKGRETSYRFKGGA